MIDYIVLLIFIISIYYTFKYKFIQFKCFKKTKEVFFNEKSKSAYEAFIVSIGSVFGVGNIVGVTTAIIYGGPGSLLWMVIFAVFSSVFSIIENTLAVKYRVLINNEYRGGVSYYISNGLNKKVLSIIIAIFLVLGNSVIFQPLQVNTLSEAVNIGFNIPHYLIFLILSLFAIFFIFKGTKKIVSFSERIVPFMSIFFILITILVIGCNISKLPNVIVLIFKDAFSLRCIVGGGLFIGIKRSLFSHEAGLGTMTTISAMSNIEKPVNQGFVQCFGVFFDTVIMCSLTGIMILIVNPNVGGYSDHNLIIDIYTKIFNNHIAGKYIAVLFMFMFALATIVSQYYLGESNLLYISGKKENKIYKTLYQCLYIMGIYIGVYFSLGKIWKIIDYGMVVLGVINLASIIKLEGKFKEELIKNV